MKRFLRRMLLWLLYKLSHKTLSSQGLNELISKTIVIDFDNTIAEISTFPQILHLKPGAREAIQSLKDHGFRIVIYSCRNNTEFISESSAAQWMDDMKRFLDGNKISYDTIDEGIYGKPLALCYIDDRAIRFRDNWKDIVKSILKKC